jgi:hypothetical protein
VCLETARGVNEVFLPGQRQVKVGVEHRFLTAGLGHSVSEHVDQLGASEEFAAAFFACPIRPTPKENRFSSAGTRVRMSGIAEGGANRSTIGQLEGKATMSAPWSANRVRPADPTLTRCPSRLIRILGSSLVEQRVQLWKSLASATATRL